MIAELSMPFVTAPTHDLLLSAMQPRIEHVLWFFIVVRSLNIGVSEIGRIRKGPFSSSTVLSELIFFRVLYVGTLFISLSPCGFLFRRLPLLSVLSSVALFFLLMNSEAYLVYIQWTSKSLKRVANHNDLPSSKLLIRTVLSSSYWISLFRIIYFKEVFLNFLLKVVVLCACATCGRGVASTTCSVVAVYQIMFMMSLFVWVPLCAVIYVANFPAPRSRKISVANPSRFRSSSVKIFTRKRSQSCFSMDTVNRPIYPERRPVSVRTVLKLAPVPEVAAVPTPILMRRSRIAVIVSLCILASCQLYRAQYMEGANNFPVFPNTPLEEFDGISVLIRHHLPRLLYCPHLHILVILGGFLFYYRSKVYESRRLELLNLNLDVEETEAMPLSIDVNGMCPNVSRSSLIESGLSKPVSNVGPTDIELLDGLARGRLKSRNLESLVRNPVKAVELRRTDLGRLLPNSSVLERLPFRDYDYRFVHGQCCEEVIGYMPIPVGKIGPLLLDGRSHYLPMATTEGALVASTNRGCRALFLAGGVKSVVFRDQMTRAPVVWFPSVLEVVQCISWIESSDGFKKLKSVFAQTSSHIDLVSVFPNPSGNYLHIRFAARTGDAMGMNMVSKATNFALQELTRRFQTMQVISLSGNMCTDKKAANVNTILGRGKSVIAEACIPATVLAQVLHSSATRLTRLGHVKNWAGSAMAGCPGMMGCNAHAANVVAGLFAATGQDLAQVVDSSACLTFFEADENGSLLASVTMPCVEVGTVGGGTRLPAQRACLDLLDLNVDRPTEHFARLIAGTVLAGELSLMAALDTDDLVTAHLRFNRASAVRTNPEPADTGEGVRPPVNLVKSDASGRTEPPHPTM